MSKPIGGDGVTMEGVAAMFADWRGSRAKREPIPAHLWNAAVSLCEAHPITHVCRHLRLSFVSLKEHMDEAKPSGEKFVAISIGCLSGGWRIECERPDGARLRVSGEQTPPVEAALRAFLS